jgi:hypothetical protein
LNFNRQNPRLPALRAANSQHPGNSVKGNLNACGLAAILTNLPISHSESRLDRGWGFTYLPARIAAGRPSVRGAHVSSPHQTDNLFSQTIAAAPLVRAARRFRMKPP